MFLVAAQTTTVEALNHYTISVSVSWGCCNKYAMDWVSETTGMYFSQFWRLGCPNQSSIMIVLWCGPASWCGDGYLLIASSEQRKGDHSFDISSYKVTNPFMKDQPHFQISPHWEFSVPYMNLEGIQTFSSQLFPSNCSFLYFPMVRLNKNYMFRNNHFKSRFNNSIFI